MFTYFTDIINRLKYFGKTYTNSDLVKKVLRFLPKSWEPKVTTIQEAKDLNTYPLDQLIGLLMTHELTIQQRSDEESKKKTISLKSTTSVLSEEDLKNSRHEEVEDNHMVLLARKFKKNFKKKGPPVRGKNSFRKLLDRMKER